MSKTVDLREFLKDWPYDPDNDTRLVTGEDNRELLQVRTPLGIEQYELNGRPDGESPYPTESALDYHLQRLARAKAARQDSQFELTPSECGELFNEATLYYFRYVRLFQLKDWARTVRDTERNLCAFDFLHRYARREEDQRFLEKWRPYVIRVNASAATMLELEKNSYDSALKIAHRAVAALEELEELEDDTFQFERERSLTAMRELAAQIQKNRPLSELEQLEEQLHRAIECQEFEHAAELRDRIRAMRQRQPHRG
jgi:hypothetical protein